MRRNMSRYGFKHYILNRRRKYNTSSRGTRRRISKAMRNYRRSH
ncbi:hypothetical protein [Peromfec virus RodF8_54]|uniref:Uncharacterized protein n=1 Tax=Peromfec virus RodF8_54 TaxID=2929383 RepID=A0A976R878_9VIRU|nr:hypothetical protein [Peromfec virus RodF8_54]